jgi:DNA mismatch endonuclease (patch repair protein)
MMSGIRGKHTRPEMVLRDILTGAGIRYRLHRKDLPGRPDIVVPGLRAAILVHGCFWHAHQSCRFATRPATRAEFWEQKLSGNAARDEAAEAQLSMLGWRVFVVWECATKSRDDRDQLHLQVLSWLFSNEDWGEIGERSFAAAAGTTS